MSYHASEQQVSTGSRVADTDGSLTLDEIFSLLANSRRRAAIRVLLEHENMSKRELVKLVTIDEFGMSPEQVDGSKERNTINASLHQTHLPKLDEKGVIEWDEAADRITLGDKASQLEWCLSRMEKDGSLSDKVKRSISALC